MNVKLKVVYLAALTAKTNISYLFELQQNVVHSSVSITSEQNRFTARHQHADQAGDGSGLACAWHAKDQSIVMSSQGFGHRLLLPRVQFL